jgi:ectoine hydroxylase-related dioxygenase (phytanoyl-CoA dioxygenase family)
MSLSHESEYERKGYTIVNDVFNEAGIQQIIQIIDSANQNSDLFRKTKQLFAIRQFLKEIPRLQPLVLNKQVNMLIGQVFGANYFPVKSIYFDKSGGSNWFVSYHQDLTISVNKKVDIEGFGPWTIKQNQFAVQPPLNILRNNFTLRIHLDDTDENNGALKVIPGSHKKGIYRPETIDWNIETEEVCTVRKGSVMIMSPLLLHASGRTVNQKQRRVLHIEFSNTHLPEPLQWSESIAYSFAST